MFTYFCFLLRSTHRHLDAIDWLWNLLGDRIFYTTSENHSKPFITSSKKSARLAVRTEGSNFTAFFCFSIHPSTIGDTSYFWLTTHTTHVAVTSTLEISVIGGDLNGVCSRSNDAMGVVGVIVQVKRVICFEFPRFHGSIVARLLYLRLLLLLRHFLLVAFVGRILHMT